MQSFIKYFFFGLLVQMPVVGLAADATPAEGESLFNPVLIALCLLAGILLLTIAALGSALIQLAKLYRDKMRKERSAGVKTIFLTLALLATAYTGFATEIEEVEVASTKLPITLAGLPFAQFWIMIGIIALELIIVTSMLLYMRTLLGLLKSRPETKVAVKEITQKIPFWDRFNKVVPIEQEEDIMLDHDYDGIRELDNSLPPWWKYGFYISIVVAFAYMWYYHAGGEGPSSEQEYIAEVQRGEQDKAAYLAKSANNVDENNVQMADAAGIEEGKQLFVQACAACHGPDGGGSVGPNLTDAYWLHGGSIQDVFKSVKYGWQDKGMKSWKDDYTPKQLAAIASFVKSLQGTKPAAPKEQQGELYVEATAAPDPAADKEKDIAIQ
ncbi:MAG: c-type cytochrome [Sphingobacteriales bacterium]|nr:MAG: c-type cytochrome [Sphingobacteriales bacterium]